MAEVRGAEQLCSDRCIPCEGGVPRLTPEEAQQQLSALPDWELLSNPDRIRRSWTVKHFMAGLNFFQAVAALAEAEKHHPDLHLSGYRNLSIEIWTHAINGLSINDFILAAKIDRLPITLKS
jgi:4a-hydroxytetrahydrobiopterin dehydratase